MTRRALLTLAGAAATPLGAPAAGDAGRKSRLRTAICAYSYRDALAKKSMTYDDLVRLAVDLDVDGLDLTVYWFPNRTPEFLLPLRRLAYRNGIEIYSISIRTEMTRATADQRTQEVANITGWIDAAEHLGAGHIRVFGGNVPKTSTAEEATPWVVEVLSRAADYAGRKGIILGLENHGGITDRAEKIIEIVQKVDSPWVGINLDTGNFRTDVFRQIEACLPWAVNVQVKAEMRDESGKSVPQNWKRVIELLRKSAYRGYLALEYEAKEDPATAVPRLIAELKRVIAQA
ncbi:MAG TPA: sugar phosphate isomerase/epimerase family protein [Bryobacteraceae bacterium]|nr:sugar phosphate isomerase/epimerase family protein [Bryobacteraceae bacterium]